MNPLPPEIVKTLVNTLDRALNAVGVITLLLTVAVFGFTAVFWGVGAAAEIAMGAFGLLGAQEIFRRQAKALLDKRRQPVNKYALVLAMNDKFPTWKTEVLKEITHRGLLFTIVGFKQFPVPLGLGGPLCPRCRSFIVSTSKVIFPARVKTSIECACGYRATLNDLTISELTQEAAKLGGIPE